MILCTILLDRNYQLLFTKRIQKNIIPAAKKPKKSIFASSIHEKKVTQKKVKPENVIWDLPEYLQNKPNPEKILFSPALASILASNQYIYYLSWNRKSQLKQVILHLRHLWNRRTSSSSNFFSLYPHSLPRSISTCLPRNTKARYTIYLQIAKKIIVQRGANYRALPAISLNSLFAYGKSLENILNTIPSNFGSRYWLLWFCGQTLRETGCQLAFCFEGNWLLTCSLAVCFAIADLNNLFYPTRINTFKNHVQ